MKGVLIQEWKLSENRFLLVGNKVDTAKVTCTQALEMIKNQMPKYNFRYVELTALKDDMMKMIEFMLDGYMIEQIQITRRKNHEMLAIKIQLET